MIEQLVFVDCLTLYIYPLHQVISDDGQLFAERTDETRGKRDNDVELCRECMLSPWCVSCKMTSFLHYAIFTYTRITPLLPLVIISPLHNHKQEVRNMGVWYQFLSIWRQYKTHPDFETKFGGKFASYTQVYTLLQYVNFKFSCV